MEMLKVTFTSKFVDDSGLSIQYLYSKVAEVATDARRYYAKDSTDEFDDEKFTQIMFLDGCFILHFIFCFLHRLENLKMPGHHITLVKRDLLLLENQLPFQVIWSLMDLRFGKGEAGGGNTLIDNYIRHIRALPPRQESFKKMIKKFVGKCSWKQAHKIWGNEETEYHQPAHLLGLLYSDHINKEACSNCSRRSSDWYSYRSAKDLLKVGIRFRPNWTNAYSDVEFQSSLHGIN
ncbi:hypothetical protein DKX38_023290 [Salix brachista]|uniref:Uncharacterized protein n=1 Tax=Salix brachista TaxID=2182728 RepID=A0A5N5JIL2_9ROSI|nr:hypothetical protein DKX38_023290 [Salix brachista]